MYISIEQALDVYDDLIEALHGKHGFGGDVAEIYTFRIMPFSPTYSMHNEGKMWDSDNRMIEKRAAEDFHSLCHIFAKKHDASISIDDIELNEWINKIRIEEIRFFHRVHVKVLKNENNKPNS